MISKRELLESIQQEIHIIKHIASKITSEHLAYRPSEKQRSMHELLKYLTVCAIGPAINTMTGNWDHMEQLGNRADSVNLDNFEKAMNDQWKAIDSLLVDATDEGLATKDAVMPWGAPLKAGAALMNMPLKCLVAYRMQLFLYAKAVGLTALGSVNCWVGVDMPAEDEES